MSTTAEHRRPTCAILFNERSAPDQVIDLIATKHAFVGYETYETVDEQDRAAYLLLIFSETANMEELWEMIGGRLPDYIQARRFPISRVEQLLHATTG